MRATQLNKAHDVTVGEHTFSVRKFDIFTNSRITVNIMSVVAPLLGGLGPLAGDAGESETILTQLTGAFASLDGSKFEALLHELLLDEGCIAYENERLTKDTLNELFCGDLYGLLHLAVKVFMLNNEKFFTTLGTQFGFRASQSPATLT